MFRVSKLHEDAIVPRRGREGDAGYDVSACEDMVLEPGSYHLIRTGIAIQVPTDCYARVAPRSGLACKGIQVGAGVVDSNYRGEVKVLLFNHRQDEYHIQKGDRIAQLVFERIYTPSELQEAPYEELSCTQRGENGFGSSGQ